MKLNTKVRYGLRAMIEIAKHRENGGVLQKEIANTQEIPIKYLEHIINQLKTSGLMTNFSSKGSGYILTKKPNEISIYDIYRAFEPELAIVDCTCEHNMCKKSNECPTRDYWFQLNTKIKNEMMQVKLADLVTTKKEPYN